MVYAGGPGCKVWVWDTVRVHLLMHLSIVAAKAEDVVAGAADEQVH